MLGGWCAGEKKRLGVVTNNRKNADFSYAPDYITEPGGILQETIDSLGIGQTELATETGLSVQQIQDVISGAQRISADVAESLEQATGVPARFWKNLESNFQKRQRQLAGNPLVE